MGGGGENAGGSGGANGGGAATGGSAGGGSGGGDNAGLCNPLPMGPKIPVQIAEQCPDFTPCGGDPRGDFVYSSLCLSKRQLHSALTFVELFCGAVTLSAVDGGVDAGIAGAVSFDGGTFCRELKGTLRMTATGTCSFANCAYLGSVLQIPCVPDPSAGTCACTISYGFNFSTAARYSIGPTTLNLNDGGQVIETCLNNSTLHMRPLDAGTTLEPFGTLTRP